MSFGPDILLPLFICNCLAVANNRVLLVFFFYTIIPLCIFAPLCIVINIYMSLTGPWKQPIAATEETPREEAESSTELSQKDVSPSSGQASGSQVVVGPELPKQVDQPVKPAEKNPRRRFDPSRDRIRLTAASREALLMLGEAEPSKPAVKNERKRFDPDADRLKKRGTTQ